MGSPLWSENDEKAAVLLEQIKYDKILRKNRLKMQNESRESLLSGKSAYMLQEHMHTWNAR